MPFARGRGVFSRGAEVSFPKGAEVVGAEVVGVEVSNPRREDLNLSCVNMREGQNAACQKMSLNTINGQHGALFGSLSKKDPKNE